MSVRDLMRSKHSEGTTPGYSATDVSLLKQASRRVQKMSTNDLLNWADVAGSGMAKGFMDYREHGDIESLAEIGLAVITLHAVVLELKARSITE
jgi:hypothetical protein